MTKDYKLYQEEKPCYTIVQHFSDYHKLHLGNILLKYYATFIVRKFELLFYKINTFLQKNIPLALFC